MSSTLTGERLRARVAQLPRYPLAHLPTPFEFLPRFSRALGGPKIYVKRDDCTGLAMGGNKTRHNEFLLADALAKKVDLFVWGAGIQSNNCRQTAAACAKAGLDCHLVLGRGKSADLTDVPQGNLLLDHLLGAEYEFVDATIGDELDREIAAVAQRFRDRGRNVYSWHRETVQPLAAVSYVECLIEIVEDCARVGITPAAAYVSSAGATGAGLALGAKALGCSFPARSICPIRWESDTRADMTDIANRAAALLKIETRLDESEMHTSFDYIAPGYGKPSCAALEAIALLSRTEGILLDPIYTGKAMAGLIDEIRHGRFDETESVVFVHTGGTPALFAYNEVLAGEIAGRTL